VSENLSSFVSVHQVLWRNLFRFEIIHILRSKNTLLHVMNKHHLYALFQLNSIHI